MKNKTIGIIGCGNMGTAIIRQNPSLVVFDRDKDKVAALKKRYKIKEAFDIQELIKTSGVIIIAVKPQDIDEVIDAIKPIIDKQLLLSIVAGITTKYIEKRIGTQVRLVRVMPNIAAQVRSGISALTKGRFAKKNDLLIAEKIFAKLGKTVIVNENYIDAFTAIAGSGPAYVFYFIESLSEAGKELGFSEKEAVGFVKEVFKGSIKLLEESALTARELREKVTSEGGTTEAALKVFEHERFNDIVKKAAVAAALRAKQLSRG